MSKRELSNLVFEEFLHKEAATKSHSRLVNRLYTLIVKCLFLVESIVNGIGLASMASGCRITKNGCTHATLEAARFTQPAGQTERIQAMNRSLYGYVQTSMNKAEKTLL